MRKIHINSGGKNVTYYSPYTSSLCGMKFNMYKSEFKLLVTLHRDVTCERCKKIAQNWQIQRMSMKRSKHG